MHHIVIEGLDSNITEPLAHYLQGQVGPPFFQKTCKLVMETPCNTLEEINVERLRVLEETSNHLENNFIVIQAGFILKTVAVKGESHDNPGSILADQKRLFPLADLTIFVDTTELYTSGYEEDSQKSQRVRQNYHNFLAATTTHAVVIDGNRPLQEIYTLAITAVMHFINGNYDKLAEAVFAVPRKYLEQAEVLSIKPGLIPITPKNLRAFKEALNHGLWIERELVETNPNYKQIIPFVGITNPLGEVSYYVRHGKEARLKDMISIGVSGHVNPEDSRKFDSDNEFPGWEIVMAGTLREIEEELGNAAEGLAFAQTIGFINDDENAVGRFHIGLAMVAASPKPLNYFRSQELGILRTLPPKKLIHNPKLESWSKILLASIIRRQNGE